jgi:hypothetical protein
MAKTTKAPMVRLLLMSPTAKRREHSTAVELREIIASNPRRYRRLVILSTTANLPAITVTGINLRSGDNHSATRRVLASPLSDVDQ